MKLMVGLKEQVQISGNFVSADASDVSKVSPALLLFFGITTCKFFHRCSHFSLTHFISRHFG